MTDSVETAIKAGARLRSQVCATEVIVVRPASRGVRLECGGSPMVALASAPAGEGGPAAGFDGGNLLGKRYTLPDDDAFEVLVTKPGAGTLADGGTPLVVKEARPLPASD